MVFETVRFRLWIALGWIAVDQADGTLTRDAVTDAGLTGGLALFVGQSNGGREIELAQTGRWLVLSIVPDEASRRQIRDAVDEAVWEKGDGASLCEARFGPCRQIGPVPFSLPAVPLDSGE